MLRATRPRRRSRRPSASLLAVIAAGLLPATAGASPQSDLEARWKGRWAVARGGVASDCGTFYTDNELRPGSSFSKGRRSFAAGETARIDKIDVKRARIDVFLELAEPVLMPRQDGPFTLLDEATCKVQLQIPASAEALRKTSEAEAALRSALALHPDRASADADPIANRRRREEYPRDYDARLEEYQAWKARQVNLTIERQLAEASEEARRAVDRVQRDPSYLDGLGAGIEALRNLYWNSCDRIVGTTFLSHRRSGSAPSSIASRSAWERGFEDGQRLAYAVELLRRLPACRVPEPPRP